MQKDKFNGNIEYYDELMQRKAENPSPEKLPPKYKLIIREGEEKFTMLRKNNRIKNQNFNNNKKNFTEKNNENADFNKVNNYTTNNYNNNYNNNNNKNNYNKSNNQYNFNKNGTGINSNFTRSNHSEYNNKADNLKLNYFNHNSKMNGGNYNSNSNNNNFNHAISNNYNGNYYSNNNNNNNNRNTNKNNYDNNTNYYNNRNNGSEAYYNNNNNYQKNNFNSSANNFQNFTNTNNNRNYSNNNNKNYNNINQNGINNVNYTNNIYPNQRKTSNNSSVELNSHNFTLGNKNFNEKNINVKLNNRNELSEDDDFFLFGPLENEEVETKQKNKIEQVRNNVKNININNNNININVIKSKDINESLNDEDLNDICQFIEDEEVKSNESFKANNSTNLRNNQNAKKKNLFGNTLNFINYQNNEMRSNSNKNSFTNQYNSSFNNDDNLKSNNYYNNLHSNKINNASKIDLNKINNFNNNNNNINNANHNTNNSNYPNNSSNYNNSNYYPNNNNNNSKQLNNYSNNNFNNYNNNNNNNNNNFNYSNFNKNQPLVPLNNYEDANLTEWGKRFPWEAFIHDINRRVFANKSFRPLQREIINAVLKKRDVFVCIPTGAGKSLTFQLSSIASIGVSVIIMPLRSLIQDQKSLMSGLGIKVFVPGEGTQEIKMILENYEEYFFASDNFSEKGINMIFLTPERVSKSPKIMQLLNRLYADKLLDRFVIDEAHCLSTWGREFREDYLQLKKIKQQFPDVQIMAITATATNAIRSDVINQLKMQKTLFFRASYNRPNLFIEIRSKNKVKNIEEDIVEFIKTNYSDKSGIVYCTSRQDCEELSKFLKSKKIKSAYFHAERTESEKNSIQENWKNDQINVIVATIAFGMGINKPDVRFVIHYCFPKSFESYYQEIGRAGRDFKDSHCLLYYDPSDRCSLDWLLYRNNHMKPHEKENNIRLVNLMQNYCENEVECRRVLILNYFDEIFNSKDCNQKCDNCAKNRKILFKDFSKEIKQILEFMSAQSSFELRFTQKQLVSFLRGISDKSEKIRNINDEGLLSFKAALKGTEIGALSRLVRLLIVRGLLTESLVAMRTGNGKERIFSVVETTNKGMSFLSEMQRKKVPPEEIEKFKIAVVDYSSTNNNPDPEDNNAFIKINDSKNINNTNSEFEKLVKSAIGEIEVDNSNKNIKEKKKINKKKNNNKQKKEKENSDISDNEEKMTNNAAENKKNTNKKKNKNKEKAAANLIIASDNDNMNNDPLNAFDAKNNLKDSNNFGYNKNNNFDLSNFAVQEDENEYVSSQQAKVSEYQADRPFIADKYNLKKNNNEQTNNIYFPNNNTNNNNKTMENSFSDSMINFLNELDNSKELNLSLSKINNSNKNKKSNKLIKQNHIQTDNLTVLNNSNNNSEISAEENNDENNTDLSDYNEATVQKLKNPLKNKTPKMVNYPQQIFQEEEDYGEYLNKSQFEELFEKLKLIRLSLYRKFNRKIPENYLENQVDLDDLDLDITDVKIGLEDIFPNTGLKELCRKIPTHEEELDNNYIFGVGILCLKKYGVYFLDEIKLFIEKHNINKHLKIKEKFESEKKANAQNYRYTERINKLRESTANKSENKKLKNQQNLCSNKTQKISQDLGKQSKLNDFVRLSSIQKSCYEHNPNIDDVANKHASSNRNDKQSFDGSKRKSNNLMQKSFKNESFSKKEEIDLLKHNTNNSKLSESVRFNRFSSDVNVNKTNIAINNINNSGENNKKIGDQFIYENKENYAFPDSDDPDFEEKLKALDSKKIKAHGTKVLIDNNFNPLASNSDLEAINPSDNLNSNTKYDNNENNIFNANNFKRHSYIFNQENHHNDKYNQMQLNNNNNNNYNINQNNENLNNLYVNPNENNQSNYYDINNNNQKIEYESFDDDETKKIMNYNNFENDFLLESANYFVDEDQIEEKIEAIPYSKKAIPVQPQNQAFLEAIEKAKFLVRKSKKHAKDKNFNKANDSEEEKKRQRQEYFKKKYLREKFRKKK